MKEDFEKNFPEWSAALGPVNTGILLGASSLLELPARRVIIRDRMPVDSVYLVLDGEVDISVEERGKAVKLGSVGPGEVLGEVSVLSGELLASSTVTSVTPVKLLRLRHQALEELVATNHDIASVLLKHFVTMLADRLRTSAKSFAELKSAPVRAQTGAGPEDASASPGKNWFKSFFDRVPGT